MARRNFAAFIFSFDSDAFHAQQFIIVALVQYPV